jgi:hypothetical protein
MTRRKKQGQESPLMNKNYRARRLDERLQDEDESIDSLKISLPPRLYSLLCPDPVRVCCVYVPSIWYRYSHVYNWFP